MPLEISSEIFIQCLPSRPKPGGRHLPMLLLDICNAWTDIAHSTPQLWDAIHVDDPVNDLASLLDAWLKRASNRVLSISFPQSLIITGEVASVIGRYAHQLQDLQIYRGSDGQIDLVMDAGPFPILKTLTVIGVQTTERSPIQEMCTTRSVMAMLRATPNLVECNLEDIFYDTFYDLELLVLPHMQHFKAERNSNQGFEIGDLILLHLSFPALRTLILPWLMIGARGLLQFLKRSAPPLQKKSHWVLVMGR
ncbi:hypothetical protein DFH09DRAFT_1041357 [Mycena vulgaris]|nr:hypothetical protein DFH09DRAFT_1041357 [Mycena vulgaris]